MLKDPPTGQVYKVSKTRKKVNTLLGMDIKIKTVYSFMKVEPSNDALLANSISGESHVKTLLAPHLLSTPHLRSINLSRSSKAST